MTVLQTEQLTLSYGGATVIERLSLAIPRERVTVLIGPNGCGKSTLLRALARLLRPEQGEIRLDGRPFRELGAKETARRLAILPQGPIAPEGLSVFQLVKQGRYPYQMWLKTWSDEDERAVRLALEATGMAELADKPVDSLSGGQRQRAWIAMTLAQDTPTLLLDEPTTYLDMAHQIDILDLLAERNERHRTTVVMVLHDLNLACRYAHHIVAIRDGRVHAQGRPEDIVDREMVKAVFDMDCLVVPDPLYGTPMCVPRGRGRPPKPAANSRDRPAETAAERRGYG